MIIKFKCINGHKVELEESELPEVEGHYCWCSEPLRVDNLDEIVAYDVEERAERYLNGWINDNGLEWTLELITNCKLPKVKEIYKKILEKRGFKIKGE